MSQKTALGGQNLEKKKVVTELNIIRNDPLSTSHESTYVHDSYAYLPGRSGGQTLIGGTASGEDLTLQSTSHATKGSMLLGTSGYDEVNNRLGLGTVSPDTTLHVTMANATSIIRLERNDTTIGTDDIVGRLEVEGQDVGAAGICAKFEAIAEGNDGETGWRFSTGIAGAVDETMRLTYTGYLGIGVVEPDAKLHVEDVTGAVQRLTRQATVVSADDIIGRIEFETQDAAASGVAAYMQALGEGSNGEVGLAFATGTKNTITERIRIDETGKVGIGSVAPAAKLHIDQASSTGAFPVLTVDQADVSEEFIRFIGSCTNGAVTGSLVEAADVGTATLKGYLKVYVQDDLNVLTDQAYFVPIYTLA